MSEKLKMHSANKVEEHIASIRALFPNCVTERKGKDGTIEYAVDFDMLRQELSDVIVEGKEERYQFTWPDKKKSVLLANAPIAATLRPCREESVDFDNTENLYIEGDNLDVLKLLQETYMGKIKMIYIDPPYNTGNDFVYNDDFAESADEYLADSGQFDAQGNRLVTNLDSNGRFHTDWLNMIYPRLKLAKDLLADAGVIFISIDDNELSNMIKVCNEVFGAQNYAATFIWTKTSTPPSLSYKCRKTAEYVLAYEKSLGPLKYYGDPLDGGDAPFLNTGNPIKTICFPAHSINFKYMSNGVVCSGQKDKVEVLDAIEVVDGWNKNPVRIIGEFKWEQATVDAELKQGTYFVVKTDKFSIRFQRVITSDAFKTPTNYLDVELNKSNGVGTNETAEKELKTFAMGGLFDYAKPLSLIVKCLRMICQNDDKAIVLDFFSGSGTTANAVMQLNAEDGGHRKYIMVQLPETTDEGSEAFKAGYKNICEIGKERIRRAGTHIIAEHSLLSTGLDVGFRVLKLDSSNMKDVRYTPAETKRSLFETLADNIKEDRTPEDLLFQVMLDLGILLSSKIEERAIAGKRVFSVNDDYLLACFDKDLTEEVIEEMAFLHPYYVVTRDSSMANDSVKTSFEQILLSHGIKSNEWKVL